MSTKTMSEISGHVADLPGLAPEEFGASATGDPALSSLALLDADKLPEDELSHLMIRYQGGDLDAFDQLYKRLHPVLRRYLITLTLNPTHADDLLQETFLQLHRSRRTFSAYRPARAWAFGIARHVFLMDRRSAARRQRREQVQAKDFEDWILPKISGQVVARDRLQRAITVLNQDQREPLLLHHVWGFSFDEVAGLLGIRSGTAKVRAHRALRRLRQILEEENDG